MSGTINAQTNVLFDDFSDITSGNSTATSGSGTTWSGNANFPTVERTYQAGGAVKLGGGSAIGSITSIPLDLSVNGGAFKVKLKVKGWTSIEGQIKITVGELAPQTISYSAKMADAFEEIEASFTGGTNGVTVKIETTTKRAFIDEVTVYYGDSGLSNDATLSAISIDGTPFSTFDPATVTYYVTLNSITVPTLAPTTNHASATFATTNAAAVPGKSEVKVTAQNGTTERIYAFHWSYQPQDGEKGSKSNPYTIAEAQTNQLPTGTTTKYWVKGYIVGGMTSGGAQGDTTTVGTNIVLASLKTADITDNSVLLPVELPAGSIREALNLVSNQDLYNAEVLVYGTLETYFSIPGLKSTSDYQILSTVGINENKVNETNVYTSNQNIVVESDEVAKVVVYTISGKVVTEKVTNYLSLPVAKGLYIVKVGDKATKVVL